MPRDTFKSCVCSVTNNIVKNLENYLMTAEDPSTPMWKSTGSLPTWYQSLAGLSLIWSLNSQVKH